MDEASLGRRAPRGNGRPLEAQPAAAAVGDDAAAELAARAARQRLLAALAPPVQHEVNNLLTVLFANVESLRRALPEDAVLPQRQVERVALASRRLDAVVRAFTTMARRPLPDIAAVEPGAALTAVEPLLRLVAGSRIGLAIEQAEGGLPPVRMDRTLFDLGLLELTRDAVARLALGGALRIALGEADGGGAALVISGLPAAPQGAALRALAEGTGGRFEVSEAAAPAAPEGGGSGGGGTTLTLVLPPAEEAATPRP